VYGLRNEGRDIPAAARNLRYRARTRKAAGLKPGATKPGGGSGQPGMAVPPIKQLTARLNGPLGDHGDFGGRARRRASFMSVKILTLIFLGMFSLQVPSGGLDAGSEGGGE